jgi:hypothetical protein
LIGQTLNPVAHAEDLVNHHYCGRFVFNFGIDHKTTYFARTILYFHPLLVARRFRQPLLGPILRLGSFAGRSRVMISVHMLRARSD